MVLVERHPVGYEAHESRMAFNCARKQYNGREALVAGPRKQQPVAIVSTADVVATK